jgi:hypothetical protein
MRRWFGAFLAATSLLAFGEPASAGGFHEAIANWFVYSLTNSCIAGNRPPAEYNFSPWNSLTLHAAKDGSYRVEVMFWPGLFKQDQAYKLSLQAEGRLQHVLDAEVTASESLKTVQPVGDDFIREVQGPKLLRVSATGTPVQLAFDISHIADVLKALDDCRKTRGG